MHKKNRSLNGAEAIREGLISWKKNKNVIFMAEGIDDPTSVFVQQNLNSIFKKNRVIEMPLSENALIGAAIGASFLEKNSNKFTSSGICPVGP